MRLLINTTGVSFNPFSAVSAEGYRITPRLVYACIPQRGDGGGDAVGGVPAIAEVSRLGGEDPRAFPESPRLTRTHLRASGRS